MYFCCSAGIHYACNCVEVQAIYAQINNLYKSCLFLKRQHDEDNNETDGYCVIDELYLVEKTLSQKR